MVVCTSHVVCVWTFLPVGFLLLHAVVHVVLYFVVTLSHPIKNTIKKIVVELCWGGSLTRPIHGCGPGANRSVAFSLLSFLPEAFRLSLSTWTAPPPRSDHDIDSGFTVDSRSTPINASQDSSPQVLPQPHPDLCLPLQVLDNTRLRATSSYLYII